MAERLSWSEYHRRAKAAGHSASDVDRWSDPASFQPEWNARAEFVAREVIAKGARVLDLGAGAMALETFLHEGCSYQPCDLYPHDPRTIVCDFNKGEFPPKGGASVVTALGLLEYLADVPRFLARLRTYDLPAIVSYTPSDWSQRGVGWLNHFTLEQVTNAILTARFQQRQAFRFRQRQVIFSLEPDAT